MKMRTRGCLVVAIAAVMRIGALSRAIGEGPEVTPPVQTPGAGTPGVEAIAAAQYDKKLAFAIAGRVGSVKVKPGDRVKAGDLLMELEDNEGKALIAQFEIKAASDVEQRIAQENLNLAMLEEQHLRGLLTKNAASPIEHQRAVIKKNLAALDLEKAKQEHVELGKQLEQARAEHAQYCLVAPVAGVVEEVNFYENQSVEPAKPVVRMVVIDPLWIDASVATSSTLSVKVGASATVRSSLPGFETPMPGKVIYIAEVGDAASTTRLVRVEMPNPKSMPAGTQVTVEISAAPGPAAAGVPSSAGAAAPPVPPVAIH